MRYCDCYDLAPGMILAKTLYSETNELLLAKGYVLNEGLIERIQRLGISPVCITEDGTEDIVIEDLVEDAIMQAANGSLKKVFDEVIKTTKHCAGENVDVILKDLKSSGFSLPLGEVKKTVNLLVDELLDNIATEWDVLPLKFITGNYFRHGIEVATLSILIGMHYQFPFKELKHLGLGAALHDLGITLMPELIDKKNCEFSPDDLIQYRNHPQYGISLLDTQSEALYMERECIYQHHEQPNGKGFPRGLIGAQQPPNVRSNPTPGLIFRHAEIIRVADAYLNLTTGGWLAEALSPEEAIVELLRGLPGMYNPHVVAALSQVVVLFPKGVQVRIMRNSSQRYIGYYGVVAVPNKKEPHKPVLVLTANRFAEKIKPFRVDFGGEKFMEIKLDL